MTAQATSLDGVPAFEPIVVNGNWGATSLNTIRAVLGSACNVLLNAFGRSPDASVRVARWDQDPQVFFDARPYEIRINARDTYWCQYIYQFSHELCHVMTNFDQCRDHRHKWFEECLCELSSLFVLHRLATEWRMRPPLDIPQAFEFAPNHAVYSKEITAGYALPSDNDYPGWLTNNIGAMEANPIRRELNGVVAVALLDRFQCNPFLWRDCGVLNLWNAGVDVTFSDYLNSWSTRLTGRESQTTAPAIVRDIFQS